MKKIVFIIFCFIMLLLSTSTQQNNIKVVKHIGYTTYYNYKNNIPDLVTYELVRNELTKDVTSRTDVFSPDPDIKNCAISSDYTKSGYDRGHMAPAADMKWSLNAMNESFYMSNVCPQHPKLNRGRWLRLEELVRTISMKNDTVWVACGPIVGNNPKTIGKHKVVVPDSFYKCIIWKEAGEYVGTGFIMKNQKCDGHLVEYMVNIDDIEIKIGYDLFGEFDDDVENQIERGQDRERVYKLIERYEKTK